jgi:hypothetical protein
VILWVLWRRGLLRRFDREKVSFFLGHGADRLDLSRRYPLWRRLGLWHMLCSPAYAAGVARWVEYRMNLFDGIEG